MIIATLYDPPFVPTRLGPFITKDNLELGVTQTTFKKLASLRSSGLSKKTFLLDKTGETRVDINSIADLENIPPAFRGRYTLIETHGNDIEVASALLYNTKAFPFSPDTLYSFLTEHQDRNVYPTVLKLVVKEKTKKLTPANPFGLYEYVLTPKDLDVSDELVGLRAPLLWGDTLNSVLAFGRQSKRANNRYYRWFKDREFVLRRSATPTQITSKLPSKNSVIRCRNTLNIFRKDEVLKAHSYLRLHYPRTHL